MWTYGSWGAVHHDEKVMVYRQEAERNERCCQTLLPFSVPQLRKWCHQHYGGPPTSVTPI